MRKILWLISGLLFYACQLYAQSRTITGKIADERGNPLPNASITLKGTSLGSTSKADGSFSITIPDNAKILPYVLHTTGCRGRQPVFNFRTYNFFLHSVSG